MSNAGILRLVRPHRTADRLRSVPATRRTPRAGDVGAGTRCGWPAVRGQTYRGMDAARRARAQAVAQRSVERVGSCGVAHGDRVVAVNGTPTATWPEFRSA